MWMEGGRDCWTRSPKHAFEDKTWLQSKFACAAFSAADRLRSNVPGGPAAGHEAQTRTMGFHGYVASPVGCAGPFLRSAWTANCPGVVETLSLFFNTLPN